MKNYINYHIDLSNVPLDVKKTFYLDDFLVKDNIQVKDNWEDFVELNWSDIKIAPFWEDKESTQVQDEEIQSMLDLESNLLTEYIQENWLWIIVRETVANKLKEVNDYFKSKWYQICIKIWYRPLSVQQKLLEHISKYIDNKHPDLSESKRYEITCEYVSDPNNFVPPHSTWWAVDLVLMDLDWNEIDMWSPINYPWEISNITYTDISKETFENRMFLCDTMLKFGFANLSSEWWHFSYWDPIWAYFYWHKESIYWKIDL